MASPPTPNAIRIFIDSNVFVTASISDKGTGRELIEYALAGKVDAYISEDVLIESERNILENYPSALSKFYELRDLFLNRVVNPSQEFVEEVSKTIEPKDVPIVAAAIEAGALFLVTFDAKHVLRQREQIWDDYGVMVLTPLQVIHSLPVE